jgi:hypothetical protein
LRPLGLMKGVRFLSSPLDASALCALTALPRSDWSLGATGSGTGLFLEANGGKSGWLLRGDFPRVARA